MNVLLYNHLYTYRIVTQLGVHQYIYRCVLMSEWRVIILSMYESQWKGFFVMFFVWFCYAIFFYETRNMHACIPIKYDYAFSMHELGWNFDSVVSMFVIIWTHFCTYNNKTIEENISPIRTCSVPLPTHQKILWSKTLEWNCMI